MHYSRIKEGETYTASIMGGRMKVRVRVTEKRILGKYQMITYEYLDDFSHPVSHARHGMQYSTDGQFKGISA